MEFITKTISGVFEEQVEKYPDRDFLIYSDRGLRFTFREFDDRCNNLAKGLLSIGLKKGDHLGLWATNVPDWFTFLFATAKIGVVLVTVNTAYKSHEIEYLIKQSDITTLALIDGFRDSDYVAMMNDLIPELKTSERGRLNSEWFPMLKNLIFIGPQKHRGMFNTQELIILGSHMDDTELNNIRASLDCHDVINMQYTSGTTGYPKGVMLTHYNIVNNGKTIGDRQKFISALIVPDFKEIEKWGKKHGIKGYDRPMLCNDSRIIGLFEKEVERLTSVFSRVEKVKKFTLLPDEWTQAGGELTPSQKIKRRVIEEKYSNVIAAIYSENNSII